MHAMKTQRRDFLKTAGLGLGALAFGAAGLPAAEKPAAPSFAKPSNMRIGMVTYLLGKDWDVATIIKNCEATKFQGVELRADHKHGVEVTLNKEQRDDVRKEFEDSDVELTSMGSAFDYHTADQAKLKKDIEATKQYIVLAHDVGASGI